MSSFTKVSSYYLKVLSPYINLREKEISFQYLIDDMSSPHPLFCKRFRRKTLNKGLLALDGLVIGFYQSSASLADPLKRDQLLGNSLNGFLYLDNIGSSQRLYKTLKASIISTKGKLVETKDLKREDIRRCTSSTQKLVKRAKTTTIVLSFQARQKNYKRVRPLLSINRFDIQHLSLLWKLPLYPDRSNNQFVQSRNRIRKQLLPIMRFYFNPQIETVLFQFTEILNEEHSYLERLVYFLVNEGLLLSCNRPSLALCPTKAFDLVAQTDGEKTSTPAICDELQVQTPILTTRGFVNSKRRATLNRFCILQKYNSNKEDEFVCINKLTYSNAFPLSSLPLVMKRRIIKSYLETITGKGTNFFHIEKLLSLLKEKSLEL